MYLKNNHTLLKQNRLPIFKLTRIGKIVLKMTFYQKLDIKYNRCNNKLMLSKLQEEEELRKLQE